MLSPAVARKPAPMLAMRPMGRGLRHGAIALGSAIGESLVSHSDPTRDPSNAEYENELDRQSDQAMAARRRAGEPDPGVFTRTFTANDDGVSDSVKGIGGLLEKPQSVIKRLPAGGERVSLGGLGGIESLNAPIFQISPLTMQISELDLNDLDGAAKLKTEFVRSEIEYKNTRPSTSVDLRVPESVAAAPIRIDLSPLQSKFDNLWASSLPGGHSQEFGGTIIANEQGALDIVNMRGGTSGTFMMDDNVRRGLSVIGVFHTHPYDQTEGGWTGISLSGGDAASLVYNNRVINIAQSGDEQFLFLRTDKTPQSVDYVAERDRENARVAELTPQFGFVQAADMNAAEFASKYNLAYYKGKSGVFRRVN